MSMEFEAVKTTQYRQREREKGVPHCVANCAVDVSIAGFRDLKHAEQIPYLLWTVTNKLQIFI